MGEKGTGRKGFRPDVEGLRAVAVVAVLLYHAGLGLVSGGYVGVDVFFVISGFLITGLLLTELERTQTISLLRFYARRIRRLLPAATVVLATVAIASAVLLSPVERVAVAHDLIACGLYVINWRLALQAVDYFAESGASPVQHFWSLAVEEQFYLVWPALMLAVAWWCRRRNASLRRSLVVTFVSVGVASFVYCLYLSYRGTGDAYFSTFTRGWELALGGVLAIVLASGRRLPGWCAPWIAVGGLVSIAVSTMLFDDETAFPGAPGLLPTLGAAAIIAAGATATSGPGWRLLTLRPVRHIGRISYSWYLWHWPVLVFAATRWEEPSVWRSVAVVVASWVPAVVTYHLIEEPFRTARLGNVAPPRILRLGVATTAVTVVAGVILQVTTPSVPLADRQEAIGAKAVERGKPVQKDASALRPQPLEAKDDRSKIYDDGCLAAPNETTSSTCVYGDPEGDLTLVAYGDSKMMQYGVALDAIGKRQGWRVVVLTKSGCPPADVLVHNANLRRAYFECDEWRSHVHDRISREKPDLIVVAGRAHYTVIEDGTHLDREESAKELERGWERELDHLLTYNSQIVAIEDNPQPDKDVPACVAQQIDDLDECATPEDKARAETVLATHVASRYDEVELIDPAVVLCRDGVCPAVIGDVLVYRDDNHLSATFVETLTDWLEDELLKRLT
ncbi:MAG TPA: acyltransferase family protein [Actinopolymorphaceae bacterium]